MIAKFASVRPRTSKDKLSLRLSVRVGLVAAFSPFGVFGAAVVTLCAILLFLMCSLSCSLRFSCSCCSCLILFFFCCLLFLCFSCRFLLCFVCSSRCVDSFYFSCFSFGAFFVLFLYRVSSPFLSSASRQSLPQYLRGRLN